MLNPDGVARGHYRTDQRGVNLNRCYQDPDRDAQPTVFAARSVVCQLHAAGLLYLYIDLHAHASKRGCFVYGNHLPSLEDQVRNE
jgi:cytosolic carboxypeptidase protein 5